ncbi:hypothetical protein MXD63_14505 [Frankia sp. Cpl3]|nr:hypothetical protein [Parafrankia colletiae]MCK9901285.1 hypothetical protein [Frankia sp. Cpl3]
MPVPAGPTPTPSGLCSPWVDAATVAARPDMADVTITPETLAAACVDASALLYILSGRQYPGICTSTVRPHNGSGGWGGIDLQLYPIHTVIEVKVDGETLGAGDYRLDDRRWLVRTDGLIWPSDQWLHLADTEAGTWSVAAVHGAEPPALGVSAASRLAAELAKERTPGATTALPRRLTNITRQGVSMTLVDPATYLDQGRTGVPEVDRFIAAVNPSRQRARPAVFSPDLPRRRRV